EHITIVSMNVWLIETSACDTGFLVCAAAAAIGELPNPDSLEKSLLNFYWALSLLCPIEYYLL
ncbi:MAG TPA: hypothetical protein VHO28_14875, partial [Ignavibacteriales bacterium]|nr:hypothetical protein [Ignavibacteriales bacterium]